MATLHILHGGIDNGDRDWLIKAARQNLTRRSWIAPKSARAGDQAVIYVDGAFFATARIATNATPRPDHGLRDYGAGLDSIKLIKPPIEIRAIKREIPSLSWANYPRRVTTPAPQVAAEISRLIELNGEKDVAKDIDMILKDPGINNTTRRALIDARLGQGKFRTDVMKRWDRRCAVTGCGVSEVLRASHIKPWRMSNHTERLDPANGLLLSANIDALFDAGLVSFNARGKMIVSSLLPTNELKGFGLPRKLVRCPDNAERLYLIEHRQSRFKG
jgi:hypothetical protein